MFDHRGLLLVQVAYSVSLYLSLKLEFLNQSLIYAIKSGFQPMLRLTLENRV